MNPAVATLQEQARALGDPTRHRVFEYLLDQGRPVEVAELTAAFALNHNAIRQHLRKLVAADLAIESVAPPSGPGRPRLRYAVSPAAEGQWAGRGPYERLALLLAEALRSGDGVEEVGRRAGRRLRLGAAAPDDPVDELAEQMARQGFEPVVGSDGGIAEVVLQACPLAAAAEADPELVCGLHQGMAEGVAETVPGLVIDELVIRDPRRAGCRIRCHVESSGPG